MFALENLTKISKKRKRVGRGLSRGRKSGRGSEGQKSRSGGKAEIRPTFQGGQMTLCRRLPQRGFNNYHHKQAFEIVSLQQIAQKFVAGDVVDKLALIEKGLIKGKQSHSVKVLGPKVNLPKMDFIVDAASEAAVKAIEEVGGTVKFSHKE